MANSNERWRGYSPEMEEAEVRAEFAKTFGAPPEQVLRHGIWLAGPVVAPMAGDARAKRDDAPLFERPDGVLV